MITIPTTSGKDIRAYAPFFYDHFRSYTDVEIGQQWSLLRHQIDAYADGYDPVTGINYKSLLRDRWHAIEREISYRKSLIQSD